MSEKNSEIVAVGHSSGGAELLVLLASAPRYNHMLKLCVLLAPLAFVSNAQGSLKYVHYLDGKKNSAVLSKARNREFVPKGPAYEQVMRIFCNNNSNMFTCLRYGGKHVMKEDFTSTILDATSSGGSEKFLIHYFQMMKSGHFRKFDFGSAENLRKYGQQRPPGYNLKDVTTSIVVVSSSEDFLSAPDDVSLLLSKLSNVIDHTIITKKEFSHIHFLFDAYAAQLVFDKINQFLD
ncbi:gastric triacylglycerol lipase-like [Colias croceus]|uniref:gastric triacylglycerol lipase-like n=1 Tax=Colias crocea TaxID=72248 RepID=UPI001E27AD20|nr:gastric triacylglycerol lipase-like [Colias croceus]